MSGVVFVVCVPTANHEHTLLYGSQARPESNNENLIKLDVELRNKKSARNVVSRIEQHYNKYVRHINNNIVKDMEYAPMEKILDELLIKLNVEHAVWCGDKNGNYYEVIFPVPAGEPCENCIHCLTELGIGVKLNSVVSVLPCSVVYNGVNNKKGEEDELSAEEKTTWNNFVDSVKSKLTVKQVVDGVKNGGDLTFDYIMLILTADCLAALGLVENNAPNITAAMLVSPLMGPVMSVTFGTIIEDRILQKTGFNSLVIGMLLSIVFGFVFGLLLGTTEMPWGFGDWPTEEMKARGNARCLWIGILWALPSGTGVALALLQGSAGPLIGVAISASLLPPVVNCGLFWALSCIWLAYEDVKIPHLKGENYTGNSSYVPIYSDYMPIEFAVNGIVSALLTVINVIFIFTTAIIMLKIKEVAAPYTSTPDVRRFWEKDLRVARENNKSFNRSTRRRNTDVAHEMNSSNDVLESAMEAAINQAYEDETLKRVKRISYASQCADEIPQSYSSQSPSPTPAHIRSSAVNDIASLDKLITHLLATVPQSSPTPSRLHSFKKSFRRTSGRSQRSSNVVLPTILESSSGKSNVTRTISLENHSPPNRVENLHSAFSASARELGNHDEKQQLTDINSE